MRRWRALVGGAMFALPAMVAARDVSVRAGQEVPLTTVTALSSGKQVVGDLIDFVTATDVLVDGVVAVPKGTPVVGQVVDARDRGAAGMSGKLVIRPLYMRVGGAIVRLRGGNARQTGMSEGEVASIVLNPLFFTGHNARIPAGTPFVGVVEKDVTLAVDR